MSLLRYLIGRPLSSKEEGGQRIGVPAGVAVFGLDALGSTAYGPEAALTVLIPAGILGLRSIVGLSGVVTALLIIVFLSYRQTIAAFPNGGGAYTVARQNLGERFGKLAGAALMLDYLLNVCVGISTGVGALVSAAPRLQPHALVICLTLLIILLFANLRGMREVGLLWTLPVCLFIACMLTLVAVGLYKVFAASGHPQVVFAPHRPAVQAARASITPWLLLRAFAAGCTALTGVEAVSNGVSNFREPRRRVATRTLTLIVTFLAVLLMGISFLIRDYGILATEAGYAGYQSVLSLLTLAVFGKGIFYYIAITSILAVLSLSANTSFAGFPQLCHVLAEDGYLPRTFTERGRRLAYSSGILVLTVLSAIVLILFDGVTDRLIPLFAIGAFLAFTMNQAGMVMHWRKSQDRHRSLKMTMNGVGALATGLTTVIVLITKFTGGAWLTLIVLAAVVVMLTVVHRHHERVERLIHVSEVRLDPLPRSPVMLVPVARWSRATVAGLQFACSLSKDVRVLYLADIREKGEAVCERLQQELDFATRSSDTPTPRIVMISSPYRSFAEPILGYVQQVAREDPERKVAVVIAEVVAAHWFHRLMHNYRAMSLKLRLFSEGNRRVVIIDMPWQLPSAQG